MLSFPFFASFIFFLLLFFFFSIYKRKCSYIDTMNSKSFVVVAFVYSVRFFFFAGFLLFFFFSSFYSFFSFFYWRAYDVLFFFFFFCPIHFIIAKDVIISHGNAYKRENHSIFVDKNKKALSWKMCETTMLCIQSQYTSNVYMITLDLVVCLYGRRQNEKSFKQQQS